MQINKKWYSVIISLLLVWFMLVLSTGILRLILNEMRNNKAMWDYIKAYAWAEASQELALLWIKENWYWYIWDIEGTINAKSVILSENYLDYTLFSKSKDVLTSYFNDWKVNSYEWILSPLWYDIIPLFYIDDSWEQKVTDLKLTISSWLSSDLSWNVIWKLNWISWSWEWLIWTKKTLTSNEFTFSQESIGTFLSSSTTNYLVLFNSWNSVELNYTLETIDPIEYFTKPELDIISTWEIWNYKQNLRTNIDNTEFLNMLKYSIYSN